MTTHALLRYRRTLKSKLLELLVVLEHNSTSKSSTPGGTFLDMFTNLINSLSGSTVEAMEPEKTIPKSSVPRTYNDALRSYISRHPDTTDEDIETIKKEGGDLDQLFLWGVSEQDIADAEIIAGGAPSSSSPNNNGEDDNTTPSGAGNNRGLDPSSSGPTHPPTKEDPNGASLQNPTPSDKPRASSPRSAAANPAPAPAPAASPPTSRPQFVLPTATTFDSDPATSAGSDAGSGSRGLPPAASSSNSARPSFTLPPNDSDEISRLKSGRSILQP